MEESIPGFFAGRSIFITGGTGFMGKVLIEKLLRSCPGIVKIYLLIRPSKKGSVAERMKTLMALPVFDRLKSELPGDLERKLHPIEGDVTLLDLGISPEDRKSITENVSVVIHAAASVRFDDPIKEAVIINVRGTRDVLKLAKEIKNLTVFLHVSTTYCNCYRKIVEETIYPAPFDWRKAIYIAENADALTLNTLALKFLHPFPNSYVFTKNLSEKLLEEERGNLPIAIFRPSIVISSVAEPFPGWVDSYLGPIGLIAGIGRGVIRCVISRNSIRADYMPVDIAIKAIIVATWKKGIEANKGNNDEISVYNGSSGYKSVTMRELVEIGMQYTTKHPHPDTIWTPTIMFTSDKTCFYFNTVIKQVLPALAIDTMAKIQKKHCWNLVGLQRRIYLAALALSYFSAKQWFFVNQKFADLINVIPDQDRPDFDYTFEDVDPKEFFQNAILGGHKYLTMTDMSKIPAAAKRQERLMFINKILRISFWIFIVWNIMKFILSYVDHYVPV